MERVAEENPDDRPDRTVRLTAPAAEHVNAMADRDGLTVGQLTRRAYLLYDFVTSLGEDEELVVRNTRTNDLERLRFDWRDA